MTIDIFKEIEYNIIHNQPISQKDYNDILQTLDQLREHMNLLHGKGDIEQAIYFRDNVLYIENLLDTAIVEEAEITEEQER